MGSSAAGGGRDITDLAALAAAYQLKLDAIKEGVSPCGFAWYPYDTLGSFYTLAKLLRDEHRFLLELIGDEPVLDIGCGDGDLAFFLESVGCTVRAIDNPATNFNQMRGVKLLKAALGSRLDLVEQDIDAHFWLPAATYGVAFLFGVLYHLQNPFQVLTTLAKKARYSILSTRVARWSPDRRASFEDLPVAYLTGSAETNEDATNYWMFSHCGLRRILERSGWEVLEYLAVGDTVDSDPASWAGDERAFCLLRSGGRPVCVGDFLRGFHAQESWQQWRWTEREFAVSFPELPRRQPLRLLVSLFFPPEIQRVLGTITMSVQANGVPLPPQSYDADGEYTYCATLSEKACQRIPLVVEFSLDRAVPPGAVDKRELGLVISSIGLE